MQTFLPYADFRTSLDCLDNKRLGKQRVEAMQILRALENPGTSRWENHPAVKMWRGHIAALKLYHDIAIRIWKERGFKNTMIEYNAYCDDFPTWLGDSSFHDSHKSNLVRKDPKHYRKYFPDVQDDLPYVWPLSSSIP
jgi:hypothetical protein